jgi:hypothetical protein
LGQSQLSDRVPFLRTDRGDVGAEQTSNKSSAEHRLDLFLHLFRKRSRQAAKLSPVDYVFVVHYSVFLFTYNSSYWSYAVFPRFVIRYSDSARWLRVVLAEKPCCALDACGRVGSSGGTVGFWHSQHSRRVRF